MRQAVETNSIRIRALRVLAAGAALACAGTGAAGGAASAATTTATSSNWGGYAATGTKFRRVTGTWDVPAASCTAGRRTFSAAWVGLGGFSAGGNALEQTGTEMNCNRAGQASYTAWYELLPAGSKTVAMTVRPGDAITATVQVRGTHVSVSLRNRTTGRSFAKKARMSSPDISSAEWIMEAPASCDSSNSCALLPLTDFGTISFQRAAATSAGGHSGAVSNSAWSSTRIVLDEANGQRRFASTAVAAVAAVPSALSSGGSSFSVAYQGQ